jgi:hypothetical protein
MDKKYIWLVILLTVIVSCLAVGAMVYGYANGLRNEGLEQEFALNAQYLDNQNYLSAYISGFYEQVDVVGAQTNALEDILLEAVKGRYDQDGFGTGSPMFVAIAEAYPEAGVAELMENWGKIQDYIASQREGYRNQQSKLLDMLRAYDTWRTKGFIQQLIVNNLLGFPTDNLVARIGDQQYVGPVAREKMFQIILNPSAIEAYEDGVMEPLTVPED